MNQVPELLGLDIGGTKTSVCLATGRGELIEARQMPSCPERGPDDWLRRTRALAEELLRDRQVPMGSIRAAGISAPGPLSTRTGALLAPPNMTSWGEVPIVSMCASFLPMPVLMNNDANAAALAEWRFGEFRGADSLIYLTMSTGLGAGIIVHGRLLQGVTDTAGEVGYHVLDLQGPVSPCGHRGSFESFCGGKNMADRLREMLADSRTETAIWKHAGMDPARIDVRCLLQAVRERDPFACRFWDDYIERLAQGIGNLIMIINPEAIVLGTIGIHAGDTLLAPLRARLREFVLAPALEACKIVPSSLGHRIGDLAAVALAMDAAAAR